ncbi:hypothetical protein AMTRI_Chr11g99910 [Amborella trichopoda]
MIISISTLQNNFCLNYHIMHTHKLETLFGRPVEATTTNIEKFLAVATCKIVMGRYVKAASKKDGMPNSKQPKHWKAQHGDHTVKGYLRSLMPNFIAGDIYSIYKAREKLNKGH